MCWDSALHIAAGNIEILRILQKHTLVDIFLNYKNFQCSQRQNCVNNWVNVLLMDCVCHVPGMYTMVKINILTEEDSAPITAFACLIM